MTIKELGSKVNELINAIADLFDEKEKLENQIKAAKELINTHKFKDKYDRELLKALGEDIQVER